MQTVNNNGKNHWAKKITASRLLKLLFLKVFLLLEVLATAQPLPPSSPDGNPVPVGEIAGIFLVVASGLLLLKKQKRK